MEKMNPKYVRAQKDGKAPLEYIPLTVLPDWAKVHKHGADKYGIRNWRQDEILMSTYTGAILRHLMAWANGEDLDPDSGLNHLYHVMACCAAVLDAEMHGKAVDDRTKTESKNGEEPENDEYHTGAEYCPPLESYPRGFGNQGDLFLERGGSLRTSPEAYLVGELDKRLGGGNA